MKSTRKRIEKMKDKILELEKKLEDEIKELQINCKHENIVESEYIASQFFSATPPIRMCEECGMTEVGWGCGYIVLTKTDPKKSVTVSREYVYSNRMGLYISDEDKGPLLRNEITLKEMIEKS